MNWFRYENVLGNPDSPERGSARQQVYTSMRHTGQNLDLLWKAPMVWISAPTWTMVSCNMLSEKLSEMMVAELKKRNLIGLISPIVWVSDGVLNGHPNMWNSLHSRNMIANQVAYGTDAYKPDAHIGLFACDKTGPGEVMWYASLVNNNHTEQRWDVPAVMMYAGSTIPGFCHLAEDYKATIADALAKWWISDQPDIVDGFKLPALEQGDLITRDQWERVLKHTVEEIGACQWMYTANTMSVALEVLGMTAPESCTQITTDWKIDGMIQKTVDCIEICMREWITPNKIITEASIRNALAVINALGWSTNALLHFKALANRLDFQLGNDFFTEVRNNTPMVWDLKPFGTWNMVDYIKNGDHKTLLRRMIDGGYIDGTLPTVTWESLWDNVESIQDKKPTGNTTLHQFDNPIRDKGNLVPLAGNLANHSVMKVTADTEKYFKWRAVCFDSEQAACEWIMNGAVRDGDVVVIRFVWPRAAGMPEMLTPTSLIKAKDLKVALISDGRFSGGSYGAVVWHVSPEAALGWPISKLQTGDEIEIDSENGTINVNGVDLNSREAIKFKDKRDKFHPVRQYGAMMGSADEWADHI